MKLRRKKIATGTRRSVYKELSLYPILNLEGNWLQDAGFTPGANVYVFVEDQKIILKMEPESELEKKAIMLYDAFH